MKKREEIPNKYKWDLSSYCKSDEECYQRLNKCREKIPFFEKYHGKIVEKNSAIIFECLEKLSELEKELSLVMVYANCRLFENMSDSKSFELLEFGGNIESELDKIITPIMVDFSKFSDKFLTELENNKTHSNFSNIFKSIKRNKKHILSEKEEMILTKISDFSGGFSENFSTFESSDIKFKPAINSKGEKCELNLETASKYLFSSDRELRKSSSKNFLKPFAEMQNFLATNFINHIKKESILCELRNYKSVLEENLEDDYLSEKVYNLLIKKVDENLSFYQSSLELKRKLLNLNEIYSYDMNAPIIENFNEVFPFEKGFDLSIKSYSPLGGKYIKIAEKSFANRWFDLFETQGKDSAQFSTSAQGGNPLIFIKYSEDINSVFTITHELGHAMHSYFADKNQPFEKAGYGIFLAEIASTVNEVLLILYLLNNKNYENTFKIEIYNYFFTMVRSAIFKQTLLSEFENSVYKKYAKDKILSKDFLTKTYSALTKKYNGNAVKSVENSEFAYSIITHFYVPYYVYKYATGLISAIKIANDLFSGKANAQENYLKFLSSGGSLEPPETLKIVGVDLEDEETYNQSFNFIKKMQKDFEELTQNLNVHLRK